MKLPAARRAARRAAAALPKCKPLAAAPMWLVLAAVALVAGLAAVLVYHAFFAAPSRRDTFADKPPPAKIVFLYMDGCGWCEKFKPQWDEFAASPALLASGVAAVSYERKDPAAAAFGPVEGYPTVLLVVDGAPPAKFQGDRTPEGLLAFLAEHGYPVTEGYYEEPTSELGAIHRTVSTTKQSQDEKVGGQQAALQAGAGGNLKSTSRAESAAS